MKTLWLALLVGNVYYIFWDYHNNHTLLLALNTIAAISIAVDLVKER